MSKSFIFILLLFISMASCQKDTDDYTDVTIQGYDLRLCACCGGLLVEIDAPIDGIHGDVYQWYQKHNKHGITGETKFPVKAKIKFYHLAESCVASTGEIEITDLILK
ncbi:MAG: hypothetical protein WAU01_00950 [Saprospiraceae bacterium]